MPFLSYTRHNGTTDALKAAMARNQVGGHVILIGTAYFSTGSGGSLFASNAYASDWNTFATEGDFQDAVDSDMAGVLSTVSLYPEVTHVVLDIENQSWQRLYDGAGDATQLLDIARYVVILQRARVAMPGIKFGFYGLPERKYFGLDDGVNEAAWVDRIDLCQDIFDASDVLFPSIYLLTEIKSDAEYTEYAQKNAYQSLRVSGTAEVLPMLDLNYQNAAGLATEAHQKLIIEGSWDATESSPTGASGSRHIDGLVLFGSNADAEDDDDKTNLFWWMRKYSTPDSCRFTI